MASLCDYIVVNDGTFSLEPGESETFSDPIPSNLIIGTNRAKPILAYKAWATPSGGTFQIEINDTLIESPWMSGGDTRGLWEAFPGTVLNPGINNTFQFRATENKIWLADIVLWFQVEV
ncbi:hypothetical protein [Ruegeria arenilitoris]|uniref:hypothetical protein n=1 Tax=Ruegeria arenilitoris TaxID=1173585 RepID=UPI00147BE141|nr:hypothetical protein [Ruegeria arenilitoris]